VFTEQLRLDHDFFAFEQQGYDSIPSTVSRNLLLTRSKKVLEKWKMANLVQGTGLYVDGQTK
jgi:hypothetical protein